MNRDIKSLKILVINDDHFIVQMILHILKKSEIKEIESAYNGFQGYQMMLKKDYDLIISNLNMPIMNGF
jgi:YesN/AraC family two-component response regulator